MPEQGVGIKIHLGVQGHDLIVGRQDQRLISTRVQSLAIKICKGWTGGRKSFHGSRRKFQTKTDLPATDIPESHERIHMDLDDPFRGCGCHLLNIHAPVLTGHDNHGSRGPVHEQAQVKLLLDLLPCFDKQLFHGPAFRPGLVGHQGHAQHLSGQGFHLFFRVGQLDAAAFSPAPGMDLGLDHHRISTQFSGRRHRLCHGKGRPPFRHRYLVLSKQVFCLIFMYLHLPFPLLLGWNQYWLTGFF